MKIERYPLCWPTIYPRHAKSRLQARFEVSFAQARDQLLSELALLGAKSIIISSNIPLRQDGLPYAKYKEPDDPGVAVYWQWKRQSYVLACDRWQTVRENLRAIGLHVAAKRGIERWGVGSAEQEFMGYIALPQDNGTQSKDWWVVLGIAPNAELEDIKEAYRFLCKHHHPDCGGSSERMVEINRAYAEAKRSLNG